MQTAVPMNRIRDAGRRRAALGEARVPGGMRAGASALQVGVRRTRQA
jgi:hypothetical protein